MRLLVTRPEPDATTLKERLAAQGHEVAVEPLLTIEYEPITEADVAGAQALVATSRNGLRALGRSPALAVARPIPVFAVGPGTTATARAYAFARVVQGPKTARELVTVISAMADINAGPLVHLAGDHLAYDLAGALQRLGFHVAQPVVYRTVAARAIREATAARIRDGALDGVVLLSPQTARIYAGLIAGQGLIVGCRRLAHYCLSAAVADQLTGIGPLTTFVAAKPNLEELLALTGGGAAQ